MDSKHYLCGTKFVSSLTKISINMTSPLTPDQQDAYYDWQDQQQKQEEVERRQLVNAGHDTDSEETDESLLDYMFDRKPGEEIEFDDND